MAPEVLRGKEADSRSDIFALGLVLYEMTTGKPAFAAESKADLIAAILAHEPPPIHQIQPLVPPELEHLIRRCLAKNPEDRWQSAHDVVEELKWLRGPVVKTRAAALTTNARRRIARPILWTAAAAIPVIVAATFYLRRSPADSPPSIRAIAVLPFANADAQSEHVSDGLTERLIDELSSSPDLRVIARTSAFRYKGKSLEPGEIGRQLNVASVVVGNLQRTGDQYEVRAELIDVSDGAQLWAKQYRERDLNLLQRHLGADISLRLGTTRSDRSRARPASPAYDFYLRGRYHMNIRGRADLLRAVEYFERAVRMDPDFALAYAGLANAYGLLVGNALMPGSEETLQRKSTAAPNKALSLDDTVAEAYASRAASNYTYYWDFAAAERDFRRAIELNPSYASAHLWYSEYLRHVERFAESRREIDLAYQLDPFSAPINYFVCWNRVMDRRYDEAIAFTRQAGDIEPNFLNLTCLLWCQLLSGRYDDAIGTIRGWDPAAADELTKALASGGRPAFWKKRIEQLQQDPNPRYRSEQIAAAYAALGERDKAFEYLDAAFEKREPVIAGFYVDPRFDNLRSDPRFNELGRRIGLPQARK